MHIFPSIPETSFEGYIFDCDGTLANSMPMFFDSWSHALNKHGARFDFTWELFHSMAGMGLVQSVERMNEKFQHALDSSKVLADVRLYVNENFHRIKPITEVVEVARRLSKSHPTSVASGGPREIVHKTLRVIEVYDIFDHVVTQDDVVNCKPDPEIFLYAAEKMGVRPEGCLVFEDSHLGIEAARRAGMAAVWVKHESCIPSSG